MTEEKHKGAAPREGMVRLAAGEIEKMTGDVPDWTLREGAIEREFQFGDFRSAIEFVNRVADLAEEEEHHPDIFVFYNKVRLVLSTHKAGGLSRKDFVLARKIDRLADREA
jgi:4a-hydroxytetrahydrobiopterin dehydratase